MWVSWVIKMDALGRPLPLPGRMAGPCLRVYWPAGGVSPAANLLAGFIADLVAVLVALRLAGRTAIALLNALLVAALGARFLALGGVRAGHAAISHAHATPHPAAHAAFGMDHAAGEAGSHQNQGKNLLMLPMARRSAADLAGLMKLSAQTWSELPPVTRPAFEIELARSHALALRAEPPHNPAPPSWREPYPRFLVASLSARAGAPVTTSREEIRGEEWFWVSLPAGDGRLTVGFPHSRIGPRPIHALLASLAGGVVAGAPRHPSVATTGAGGHLAGTRTDAGAPA